MIRIGMMLVLPIIISYCFGVSVVVSPAQAARPRPGATAEEQASSMVVRRAVVASVGGGRGREAWESADDVIVREVEVYGRGGYCAVVTLQLPLPSRPGQPRTPRGCRLLLMRKSRHRHIRLSYVGVVGEIVQHGNVQQTYMPRYACQGRSSVVVWEAVHVGQDSPSKPTRSEHSSWLL